MEQCFVIVDVNEHLNYKLFIKKIDIGKINEFPSYRGIADGVYLDADTLPDSNELIVIKEIPYAFPDKSLNKFDSISCEGQIIDLLKEEYSRFFLLTMGTWGNYHEKLKVTFEDNSWEYITIDFVDWWLNGKTNWIYDKYNVYPSINAKGIKINSNDCNYIFTIYSSKCDVPNRKPIKSLELPYNPNLFIFAITVEKV